MSAPSPIHVVISGAAGQIGYSLVPIVASGRVFGPDQPLVLHLFDIPRAAQALEGLAMEVDDCAYPLVRAVHRATDPREAFRGAQYVFLVGGFPRLKGMERSDLLAKNAAIFVEQGRALNEVADRNVKVLVVANPANTNALIAAVNAPDIPRRNFNAMTRLDQNRATAQVASRLGVPVSGVSRVAIWGNHSSTMYPDTAHSSAADQLAAPEHAEWAAGEFMSTVQGRGAAIIAARGASSAMSAANAAGDHMRDWFAGTPDGEYSSMGVISDGNTYGVPEGLVFSFPCVCKGGEWEIVPGLSLSEDARRRLDATAAELVQERETALPK